MRTGLRIRGSRGDPDVKEALIKYARWLRNNYDFPIRVPVYLFPGETIITGDGGVVTASFFAPWSREVEPFIRIATGGYAGRLIGRSREDALSAYITSLSHEVIHYFQWVETGEVYEDGVIQQAVRMLQKYSDEVGCP